MLIGTIDFYHFIPLSLTFTLPWVTRSVESKTYWLLFLPHFYLIKVKFDVMMKQLKLKIQRLLFSKIYGNKGNNCCFTDCGKELWRGHVFRCLWIDLIRTWCDGRYYCIQHFDTSLIDHDLDSRSQKWEKAKTFLLIISQNVQSVLIELGILLRLVGVMNLILILSGLFNIQGKEPYLYNFIRKKSLTLACNQTFTDWFLSILVWW